MRTAKPYIVVDNLTGTVRGTYATRRAAQRRADVLDLEYGAIRHRVIFNALAER